MLAMVLHKQKCRHEPRDIDYTNMINSFIPVLLNSACRVEGATNKSAAFPISSLVLGLGFPRLFVPIEGYQ